MAGLVSTLAISIIVFFAGRFARLESAHDYARIAKWLSIIHAPRAVVRGAALCVIATVGVAPIFVAVPAVWYVPMWAVALIAAGIVLAYTSFSLRFRIRLNDHRALSPYYLSPSNWYDYAFLYLHGLRGRQQLIEHWSFYASGPRAVRAGITAIQVEAGLAGFAGSVIIYIVVIATTVNRWAVEVLQTLIS